MKFINQNDFYLTSYKITTTEFYKKKTDGSRPIVLDIRPLDISSAISIDGSYSLPAEMFNERLIQLPPFGTIILYSDKDNTDIHDNMYLLWENGFTEIFYIDGGFEAVMLGLFEISKKAQKHAKKYIQTASKIGAIKVEVKGQDYNLIPLAEKQDLENLYCLEFESFSLYINPESQRLLQGSKLDFQEDSLQIDHPRMHEPKLQGTIKERIQKILDEQINPMVEAHGGIINLIDVVDDTVYIEMGGGCQGCGMSTITLKKGVETAIKDNVAEINHILDTTDHASGTNPYYKPEEV